MYAHLLVIVGHLLIYQIWLIQGEVGSPGSPGKEGPAGPVGPAGLQGEIGIPGACLLFLINVII